MKKKLSQQNPNGPIMMNAPGKEPKALTNQEVVQLIQQQQQTIQHMTKDRENMQTNIFIHAKSINTIINAFKTNGRR